MSVYVMERRDMMIVVTEKGKMTQKGTKVKKGERDSCSAVQCDVLVSRCTYIPVQQAWPCLCLLDHLHHENPAIKFSTCKSGR